MKVFYNLNRTKIRNIKLILLETKWEHFSLSFHREKISFIEGAGLLFLTTPLLSAWNLFICKRILLVDFRIFHGFGIPKIRRYPLEPNTWIDSTKQKHARKYCEMLWNLSIIILLVHYFISTVNGIYRCCRVIRFSEENSDSIETL